MYGWPGLQNTPPSSPDVSVEIKFTIPDGAEFNQNDILAWSKGDFDCIGLDRRHLRIIRELSKIIVEKIIQPP